MKNCFLVTNDSNTGNFERFFLGPTMYVGAVEMRLKR